MIDNKNLTPADDFKRKYLALWEKHSGKKLAEMLGVDSNYISRVKQGHQDPSPLFKSAVSYCYAVEFPDADSMRPYVAAVMHDLAERYKNATGSGAETLGSDNLADHLGIGLETGGKEAAG